MGRKPAGTQTTEADRRLQGRADEETALWLKDRAARMIPDRDRSIGQQANAELALWRQVLAQELAGITMPLAWARAVAEVTAGPQVSASVAAAGSVPVLYAECFEAFRLARRGPAPDLSSYAGQHGIDEQALLDYLASLGPAADHALRDAFSRWWQHVQPRDSGQWRDPDDEFLADSEEGFAAAGLRVTAA